MINIVSNIKQELKKNTDEKTKNTGQNFFKEKIKIHGIKTATVSKIASKYWQQIQNFKKIEIIKICEELFSSEYMEEAFVACYFSDKIQALYIQEDIKLFEKWILKYITNWATCDTLCNHTIGTFLINYPNTITHLLSWTKSNNRWLKRASAVSLIIPARKGFFSKEIFKIATNLINDPDDLVQKGYGWMLKAASQYNQNTVFKYICENKKIMPRTALRYAIEKMPINLKKVAMAK